MTLKTFMYATALLSLTATVGLALAYVYVGGSVIYALAITAGTIFYHFAMRLAVGCGINACCRNRVDHTRRWFKPRSWEKPVYRMLHLPKWKRFVPTFDPATFDPAQHTIEELLQASCQAELIHTLIMLLSFLPISFAIWFDETAVFVLTSCLAALADGVFVILQRYNRPKLLRLLERQRARAQK